MNNILSALMDGNVQAFLRVIRAGEGTADEDGYRRHFGGELFTDFSQHPKRAITKQHATKTLTSTAAGAYQFLSRTWSECQRSLGLPDFSPASQDLAAVFLINRRGALDDVLAGRLESAILRCGKEWASLPGSPYGQPVRTMAQCRATYEQFGGRYEPSLVNEPDAFPDTQPAIPVPEVQELFTAPRPDQEPYTQEAPMPLPIAALVSAFLPSIVEAIPKLGTLFGSGSKVAERNVAAAGAVMNIVQQATGAINAQDAVERINSDPAMLAAATRAVEAEWYTLTEAGGGGIDGARKADAAAMAADGPWWQVVRSPSFVVALLLLPMVYLILGNVTGLYGAEWSPDARAGIAGSIAGGIVMGLIGYYYGQTTSRNRTPAVPGEQT